MKTSKAGINLIKSFEGLCLSAYKATPSEQYYTIGYGHYGPDVKKGMVINSGMAETFLNADLVKFEVAVAGYNDKYHWNQAQFDALVSFSFNCGVGNLKQLLNDGKRTIAEIKEAWPKYNKAGGKVLKGLVARRAAELELFTSMDTVNIEYSSNTEGFEIGDYKVTATSLRIRTNPDIMSDQIGSLKKNEIFNVTEVINNGGNIWGHLIGNKYVCLRYLGAVYAVRHIVSNIKAYSLKTDSNKILSTNFKVKEFKCKDGSDIILIDDKLVYYLQQIRNHFGKAVIINSAFRTATYNKKIGGATKSKHIEGRAADIKIAGIKPIMIAAYAESIGIKGIGLYDSFVHVDTRTNKSFWKGSNQIKMNTFM